LGSFVSSPSVHKDQLKEASWHSYLLDESSLLCMWWRMRPHAGHFLKEYFNAADLALQTLAHRSLPQTMHMSHVCSVLEAQGMRVPGLWAYCTIFLGARSSGYTTRSVRNMQLLYRHCSSYSITENWTVFHTIHVDM
jgi:hypothetical protein